MDTRTVLGLLVAITVLVVSVYAQNYYVSGEQEPLAEGDVPIYQTHYQLIPLSSGEVAQIQDGAQLVASPYAPLARDYWADRARGGKGKGKKKKKKKKGKGKKKGGWNPVQISTHGVRVGWKGWIPPVHGKGWGWVGWKKGHFKFVDYGPAWGKPQKPHFPEPGPPVIIKHHPIHLQHHGW
ncbi:unnamed protein product [Orchesella dallaii]|uniref:Uncharacterized protein n=1 Tax=Orchesella dallaii TaxID=48710 RepID=A0ABP1S766_9HEXA